MQNNEQQMMDFAKAAWLQMKKDYEKKEKIQTHTITLLEGIMKCQKEVLSAVQAIKTPHENEEDDSDDDSVTIIASTSANQTQKVSSSDSEDDSDMEIINIKNPKKDDDENYKLSVQELKAAYYLVEGKHAVGQNARKKKWLIDSILDGLDDAYHSKAGKIPSFGNRNTDIKFMVKKLKEQNRKRKPAEWKTSRNLSSSGSSSKKTKMMMNEETLDVRFCKAFPQLQPMVDTFTKEQKEQMLENCNKQRL